MIAVLTCDIIGSRFFHNADRALLQDSIRKYFEVTCKQFPQAKADILSFRVTAGDEFQFSLAEPSFAYKFLLYFRLYISLLDMKPMPRFRCGIGIGERSVTGETSYEMDGSAYYLSRQALNAISGNSEKNRLTNICIEDKSLNRTLEVLCTLMDSIENDWSLRQRQFILTQLEGKTLMEAASALETTFQNISKSLSVADWNEFEQSLLYIETSINKFNLYGLKNTVSTS
jgi:hypothetical protein